MILILRFNNIKKDIEAINKKVGDKNMEYTKQLEIVKNYKLQLETKIEVRDGYEKVLKRNINSPPSQCRKVGILPRCILQAMFALVSFLGPPSIKN